MYGFCSNNTLYSACLSSTISVFLLNFFDTRHCNYFKPNLSVLIYIKVLLIKKPHNTVLQSSKHKESTFPHKFLLLSLSHISLAMMSKNVFKSGVFGKKIRRVIAIEERFKPSAH